MRWRKQNMAQYINMETAAHSCSPHINILHWKWKEKKCARLCVATLSGRCDSDGLCCELLIKISRVRLRGNLGLKRWDQLLKQSTHGDISGLSNSCPPDDNLQGFPEGIIYSKASSLSPWLKNASESKLRIIKGCWTVIYLNFHLSIFTIGWGKKTKVCWDLQHFYLAEKEKETCDKWH